MKTISDADYLLANNMVTMDNQDQDDDEDIQVADEVVAAPIPDPTHEHESFKKSIMNIFRYIVSNKAFEIVTIRVRTLKTNWSRWVRNPMNL
ncbi:hypothetical protein LXL04_014809 [Taraxacum kok-saghyz]